MDNSNLKFKFLKSIGRPHGEYPGGPILIHGVYASGKTHFLGDALRSASQHGEVIFANVCGEDGMDSSAHIGLLPDTQRLEIDRVEAAEELAAYCTEKKVYMLAVDSLSVLYDIVIKKKTLGRRVPSRGRGEDNEWSLIHLWMEELMHKLRRCAHHVVMTAPSQLGVDLVKDNESLIATPMKIMPEMPGKYGAGGQCAKWFNLVGYLSLDDRKKSEVKRQLHFESTDRFLTRQRLPRELTEPLDIGETGGWDVLMAAVAKSYFQT